jgi:hypothetical protein
MENTLSQKTREELELASMQLDLPARLKNMIAEIYDNYIGNPPIGREQTIHAQKEKDIAQYIGILAFEAIEDIKDEYKELRDGISEAINDLGIDQMIQLARLIREITNGSVNISIPSAKNNHKDKR